MTLRFRAFGLIGIAAAVIALLDALDARQDRRLFSLLHAAAVTGDLHQSAVAIRRHALAAARGSAVQAESVHVELGRAGRSAGALQAGGDSLGAFGLPAPLRVQQLDPLLAAWEQFRLAAELLARGASRDTLVLESHYVSVVRGAGELSSSLGDAARLSSTAMLHLMRVLRVVLIGTFALLMAVVWFGVVRPSDRLLYALERRASAEASAEPVDVPGAAPELARLVGAFNRVLERLEHSRDELRRTVRATDTLYAALRAGQGVLDLASLVQVVAEVTVSAGGADFGAVTIREPGGRRIRYSATGGIPKEFTRGEVVPDGLLATLLDGHAIRSDAAASHPPFTTLLAVPVKVGREHRGEIYAANLHNGRSFGEDENASLHSLATFLGYAVEQSESHASQATAATVRMTAELATGMAHEINNAVTGVRLNLQAIADLVREELPGGGKEETVSQIAAESVAAIDRVAALIRRVLDAAAVRAGAEDRECVNVAAAVRRAADLAQVETPAAAPIAVESPPEIRLDGRPIGQVTFVLDALMRWCARRVAAGTGAGGDVFARVGERPGGAVVVEIGHRTMPLPEDLETVFKPAVRPTATAGGRMEFELDLLLARAAVQAAGARIRAVPGSGGRGVLFQVEFPAPGRGG